MSNDQAFRLKQYILSMSGLIVVGLAGWTVANTQALLVTAAEMHKDIASITVSVRSFQLIHDDIGPRLDDLEYEQYHIKNLALNNQQRITVYEINYNRNKE